MQFADFEKQVEKALEEIPDKFREKLENITIEVEPDQLPFDSQKHMILGQYRGVPWSRRGPAYQNVLPDKIIIYKKAFDRFPDKKIPDLIVNVLQHEIGHYFGMSEEELARYKRI
ncbi:MAG: metallopeptidase family protein [Candidatus Margulisiibacteriota bacterium]|nr:metallopeptidase family protein [Candidatus Margulisiibacteriota bacterium]